MAAVFGHVLSLVVGGYVATVIVLSVARHPAVSRGALVEGSQASGLGSHLLTWIVVGLIGAIFGWVSRHGLSSASIYAVLVTALAAVWELDALREDVAGGQNEVAWVFLAVLFLAPIAAAAVADWLKHRVRKPR